MAIGAFLDFYPDEIFYSMMARFATNTHYYSLRAVIDEVFGSQQMIATLYFPSHLDALIARLSTNSVYTADMLINQHTLLPFFAPFLPPERVVKLKEDMRGAGGPSEHMRAGTMASIVSITAVLRYCPECVRQDRAQWGESYWHRSHQLPGVQVCLDHDVFLESSGVAVRHQVRRLAYISAEEALQHLAPSRQIPVTSAGEVLRFIAKSAVWLLHQSCFSPGLDVLRIRYQQALIKRDLASYHGRVKMATLLEAFCEAYPSDLLRELGSSLNPGSADNWLARLARKPHSAQHPLQHLLFLQFLGCSVEDFFGQTPESLPFGAAPWLCLNKASAHYLQSVITTCEVTYPQSMGGHPTGTFICDCGFIYSRSGPDTTPEDRLRRGKIIQFGTRWEEALKRLWGDATFSVNAIAQHLEVDPLTVKRQAVRLGLPLERQHKGSVVQLTLVKPLCQPTPNQSNTGDSQSYRTAWISTMQQHPDCGTKALRALVPQTYTWLYRHDKAWLQTHLPLSERILPRPRVDWAERDKELAEKIAIAATALKQADSHLIQVTVAALGRAIGQLALLQQHLDKLPSVLKNPPQL